MDTYALVKIIKKKWSENNYNHLVVELDSEISKGCTGSEVVGIIGSYLNSIRKENKEPYNLASNEIEDYLEYYHLIFKNP